MTRPPHTYYGFIIVGIVGGVVLAGIVIGASAVWWAIR